jgi:hypothetical protein
MDNLSHKEKAGRVEGEIRSLVTEQFFLDFTKSTAYLTLDDKGKDAILYIQAYFNRIHGVSLEPLFNQELEALFEDTQSVSELLSQRPEGSFQDSVIAKANYLSSKRIAPIAYALAGQDGISAAHKRLIEELESFLSKAKSKFDEISALENKALTANNEQLKLLNESESLRNDLTSKFDKLEVVVSQAKSKVETDYGHFKDTLFKTMEMRMNDLYDKLSSNAEERLKSIEEPLRRISSKTVTDVNAQEFEDEALQHNRQSHQWLIASIGVLVLLFVLGFWFNYQVNLTSTQQVGAAIEATAFRVLIFSLGTFALIFCTKTYASHRHNFTINRQRSNALKTFELFANGSSDAQVKDAILLQAAQCVFSPQTSGYIRNEPDPTANTQVARVLADLNRNQ